VPNFIPVRERAQKSKEIVYREKPLSVLNPLITLFFESFFLLFFDIEL